MRVITGTARGRRLREPVGSAIRPTTDQGKEAFASLDPACEPVTILDYDYVIAIAKQTGYIKPEQEQMLLQ